MRCAFLPRIQRITEMQVRPKIDAPIAVRAIQRGNEIFSCPTDASASAGIGTLLTPYGLQADST
jgi:hypothetical protein